MKKLTTDGFIEVLEKNNFRDTFNLSKEVNLESISKNTLEFIQKGNKSVSNGLIQLNTLLKMYGITIQSYFNFIENMSYIDFTDKQYRDFLCDSYRNLLNVIDNYSISDSEKLKAKIEIIERAEKEKRRSEAINMLGRTTTIVAGIAIITTAGCVIVKEISETKRDIAEMAMKEAKSKNFSKVLNKGIDVVGNIACSIITKK